MYELSGGTETILYSFCGQQNCTDGSLPYGAVILDPSGYIITNAHVVKGAERVQVVLNRADRDRDAPAPRAPEPFVLPATVVGLTDYFDLALLKVEASGLPTLPFADFRNVTQGQVVIALGSPLGLDNSVTMGIVSSVARLPSAFPVRR